MKIYDFFPTMHPLYPKTVSLNIKYRCRQHPNLLTYLVIPQGKQERRAFGCYLKVGARVRKELMILKCRWLVLLPFCVGMLGCTFSGPANSIEFEDAFELSSFLKTHIPELLGQVVEFQVIDGRGGAVPFGLLKFQWVDGGRMSFQTNPSGQLHVEFEKDILAYEVMVSAESKGNKVRVRW